MSYIKNIFGSKLSVITLIVLPFFLVLIILAWVYMLFFNNSNPSPQTIDLPIETQTSSSLENFTKKILQSSKSNSSKTTFDALENPKIVTKTSSSSITLTSPVSSTPEIDVAEINTLLDKIESLDNNDDIALDNQILEN
jgi:cytoskeletal protein RodZ